MKSPDLQIALFIFLASTSLTAFAYNNLLQIEKPEVIFGRSIPAGSSTEFIMHEGKCVGKFNTTLLDQKIRSIKTVGEISIKLGDKKDVARVSVDATFNVLGQLFESKSSLSFAGNTISIATKDANPILIDLTATIAGTSYSRSVHMPGPVLLTSAEPSEQFQLEYPPLAAVREGVLPGLTQKALTDLGVTLEASQGNSCEWKDRAIDISSLVGTINQIGLLGILSDHKSEMDK